MKPAPLFVTSLELDRRPDVAPDQSARVVQLGDAIAELAARLHAATYELLVLLRTFDAAAGWNNGFLSCAHWLHWRTGIDLGAAREKVRVARALATLPLVSAAMRRGEVSYAKVRALTRIATPRNEAQLVDVALAGTAAHVERLVRAWRRVNRVEAARQTEHRHLHRELVSWVDEDGMLVIRGRLTPEVGAVVQQALEAAADRLFRESAQAPPDADVTEQVTAAQRRADALGRVAECALAADLDRGTAGDRYQVVVHVDAATLLSSNDPNVSNDPNESGQAVLELGAGAVCVSAETSQRIACDASLIVMRHGADGSTLDVGRKRRTIPPAIRRALAARDCGCQFPGCTSRRCDGHHIRHWAHGGATRLENIVSLCRRHHREVHEGRHRVERGPDGRLTVHRGDGTRIEVSPPAPRWADTDARPLGPTIVRMATDGLTIGPDTATPAWTGERFDVAWAIDVLRDSSCSQFPERHHRVDPSRAPCRDVTGHEDDDRKEQRDGDERQGVKRRQGNQGLSPDYS